MSSRRRRSAPGGFTLLEVLAAVAVLALVYTALARAAMQGLAHEGDASRRLHASLLADQALAEIEGQLAAAAPELGLRETPLEDYTISVEVRPYEELGALGVLAQEAAAEAGAPARDAEAPGDAGPAFQLLAAPPGTDASPLLMIDVRVRWIEGAFEQEVSRTTFAADPAAVAAAMAGLASETADEDADDADAEAPASGGDSGASQPDAAVGEPDPTMEAPE